MPNEIVSVPSQMAATPFQTATHWVHQLMGFFPPLASPPTDDFLTAMTMLFTEYPERAVAAICHPTTGLASKTKFLPTLAECKAALEAEMKITYAATASNSRARAQMLEREELERIAQERAEGKRATYDQLIAKLPPSLRVKKPGHIPEWVPSLEEVHKKWEALKPPAPEEKNPFE